MDRATELAKALALAIDEVKAADTARAQAVACTCAPGVLANAEDTLSMLDDRSLDTATQERALQSFRKNLAHTCRPCSERLEADLLRNARRAAAAVCN